MRANEDLLNDIGINKEYNPRGGIVPDLADRLMIEVFCDIRDILDNLRGFIKEYLIRTDKGH